VFSVLDGDGDDGVKSTLSIKPSSSTVANILVFILEISCSSCFDMGCSFFKVYGIAYVSKTWQKRTRALSVHGHSLWL